MLRLEVKKEKNILMAEMPRDIFEDMYLTVLILELRRIKGLGG